MPLSAHAALAGSVTVGGPEPCLLSFPSASELLAGGEEKKTKAQGRT